MKPKFSLAALASATALTGAVLLVSTGIAQGCMFSGKGGAVDRVTTTAPTGNAILSQSTPDQLSKLGIAGASLIALAGMVWGGMALKSRLTRDAEPAIAEAPDAALPPAASFEPATFAIVVPPEALIPAEAAEAETALTR